MNSKMSDKKSEAEKAAKEYVADYVSESARDFASFGFMSGAKWMLEQAEEWCGSAHPRSMSGIEYLNGEQLKADELHEYLERLLEPTK